MACPYFYPVARFESDPWSVPPRLPLGDAYSGECRAPGSPAQPDETRMRQTCNVGYGRHSCEYFPANSPADAIRLHLANEMEGVVQIQYIFEQDCWPRERGLMEWRAEQLSTPIADENLRRQAEVFIASYLRRRRAA